MTSSPASFVLDNEAVQALLNPHHPKHVRTAAALDMRNRRKRKGAVAAEILVPTAVRVEAGWDRSSQQAMLINRMTAARDVELGPAAADRATQLRLIADVSVVDATVAQAAEAARKPAVIVTSDAEDMTRLAGVVHGEVRVLRV